MLSEISQTQKDNYSMTSLICGLLKESVKFIIKETDGYQRLGVRGKEELLIKWYTLHLVVR